MLKIKGVNIPSVVNAFVIFRNKVYESLKSIFAIDGDITPVFDDANYEIELTLGNTSVTPGSYTNSNITVDSKGRITNASNGSDSSLITAVGNTSTINLSVTGSTLTGAFASTNISQFTNNSGYLTSLSGALLAANNLSDLANTSTARTNLGVAIGTNVQAYDADLTTWAGITPGTGVGTALAINVGNAGAFVTFNGALGTPSSGTATNLTGLPLSTGVTGTLSKANGGSGATYLPTWIVDQTTTTVTHTGTTTETLKYSVLVSANTFAANDISDMVWRAKKSGTAGTMILRLYINSSNSLSGATIVATLSSGATSIYQQVSREILWKSATTFEVISATATSLETDTISSTSAVSTITYDTTAALYWIISIQLGNSGDTASFSGWTLRNNRL